MRCPAGNPDLVGAGLDEPVAVGIVKAKFIWRNFEGHVACFTRLQQDFLKAFQFAHRTCARAKGEAAGEM